MNEITGAKRGREPVVALAIADDLRHQLATGRLTPGMKLPRRLEMQRIYDSSPTTIQSAMDRLIADGIIETHGRRGTFVTRNAPLVSNLALVFHASRNDTLHWNRFYEALVTSAAAWQQEPPLRFITYHCTPSGEPNPESQWLQTDMRALKFGGIINITGMLPDNMLEWQRKFTLPLVVVTVTGAKTRAPAHVYLSYTSFLERAVEHLARQGRKRIGILVDPGMWFNVEETAFEQTVARCGVEARQHHRQMVSVTTPICARSASRLMMHLPPDDRPDGLIIADDNFGSHAVQGLQDAGVQIGADVSLVVHANFPSVSEFRDIPVTRLGFNARTVLESAVQIVNRWRETGVAGGRTEVSAEFEGKAGEV